ncbi:MAG TPA: hypothetical protein VJ951_04860 [Bacteroidales bacterium]|nr:hypothetical protein [Bacteroidales bacterium]
MNTKYIVQIISICLVFFFASCERDQVENPNLEGNDYELTSQQEVDGFSKTENIRTLTVSGEDITDLSNLSVISLKNLIVKNTGIVNLSIPALQSVTVSLQISGNSELKTLNGLNNLKFFGGNMLITDNDELTDISGILGLRTFYGTLTISGNPLLGENVVPLPDEEFGFGPIKRLIEEGVISGSGNVSLQNNHPDAVGDASLIGIPVGETIIDYNLTSKSDVLNFSNFDDEGKVKNLTIKGSDIDDATLNSLIGKISEVQGTFTLENTSCVVTWLPENGGFFGAIEFGGSIIIRNNQQFNNINSFMVLKGTIHGDLILEDNPQLDFGWDGAPPNGSGFQNITEIEGSLIVRDCPLFMSLGFKSLERVGEDFIIEKGEDGFRVLWNFADLIITHIGGDIIIRNNPMLNSLLGLNNLTYVGAEEIIIENNGALEVGISDGDKPGLCWVRDAYDSGVIVNENVEVTLEDPDGNPVDFETLGGCGL